MARVTLPARGGPFPLVLFSPDAGESRAAYVSLAAGWAARGYVVIRVGHGETRSSARPAGRPSPRRARGRDDWADRPRNLRFVLARLPTLAVEVPGFRDRAALDVIGAGGHGAGARAAALLGGALATRVAFPGGPGFRAPEVRAVFMLSPPGLDRVIHRRGWNALRVPQLYVTGTRDVPADASRDPAWRLGGFRTALGRTRYLAFLDGAASDFGGITGAWRFGRRRDAAQVEAVRAVTTAFFDAHLKGDPVARRLLETGAFAGRAGAGVRVYDAGDRVPAGLGFRR